MTRQRKWQIKQRSLGQKVQHRLTWRMWHPVTVLAATREEAILEALRTQPSHIPAGTELYYGMVGGEPVGFAVDKRQVPLDAQWKTILIAN